MNNNEIMKFFVKDVDKYPIQDYLNETVTEEIEKNTNSILNQENLDEDFDYDYKTFKRDKQLTPFTYFNKKQFEIFSGNFPVKIVGNTNLRDLYDEEKEKKKSQKVNEKKSKKKGKLAKREVIGSLHVKYKDKYLEKHPKKEFNAYSTKEFKVYKAEKKNCIGYLYVGENSFIRIEKNNAILLILLLFIVAALILSVCFKDEIKEILPIANADDYDGSQNNNNSFSREKYIEIPIYQNLVVSDSNPYINLHNPAQNTVYFQYFIYIDENGDGYVDTSTTKPIFETLLIPEGQMIQADLNSVLTKGDHVLYFNVKCYDVTTQSECDGSNITDVKITVK